MQSAKFLAVYNIAPVLRGHSLVVPRSHISSLFDLSQEDQSEFMDFSLKVTRVLLSAFKGEGYDWSIQEGKSAGQSVEHLHLHIVIRNPGDLPEGTEWYLKIRENESLLLESDHRQRLSEDEYRFYTDYLRNEYLLLSRI